MHRDLIKLRRRIVKPVKAGDGRYTCKADILESRKKRVELLLDAACSDQQPQVVQHITL